MPTQGCRADDDDDDDDDDIAISLQQCLHERTSMLCYTYIACFVPHLIYLIIPSVSLRCETRS